MEAVAVDGGSSRQGGRPLPLLKLLDVVVAEHLHQLLARDRSAAVVAPCGGVARAEEVACKPATGLNRGVDLAPHGVELLRRHVRQAQAGPHDLGRRQFGLLEALGHGPQTLDLRQGRLLQQMLRRSRIGIDRNHVVARLQQAPRTGTGPGTGPGTQIERQAARWARGSDIGQRLVQQPARPLVCGLRKKLAPRGVVDSRLRGIFTAQRARDWIAGIVGSAPDELLRRGVRAAISDGLPPSQLRQVDGVGGLSPGWRRGARLSGTVYGLARPLIRLLGLLLLGHQPTTLAIG